MLRSYPHAEYAQGRGRGYGGAAGVQRGVSADTNRINHDQRERVPGVDAHHAPPEERTVSVWLQHVWELLRSAVQRETCDFEERSVSVSLEHVRKLLRCTDRESQDGDPEERTVSVWLQHLRKHVCPAVQCETRDSEERTVSVWLQHAWKLLRGTDRKSQDGDSEERTVSVQLEHIRKLLRGTDREPRDGDPEERIVSVQLEHARKLLRGTEVGSRVGTDDTRGGVSMSARCPVKRALEVRPGRKVLCVSIPSV